MPSVTQSGSIQVRVGEVRQLFNSIDPSPFRERDLDPQCEEFIVGWAREFSPEQPLKIEIRLERELPTDELRRRVLLAVKNHFIREAQVQNLRVRRTVRDERLSLAIGVLFLTLCISAASFLRGQPLGPFGSIFTESLVIAGWVAMWHPMEVLLYGLWPLYRERRLLERLGRAEVTVLGAVA
jgi:hypothetical protein